MKEKQNNKAVVYPVDKSCIEIFKHKNLIDSYQKLIPVLLDGEKCNWRYVGDLVKNENLKIELKTNFKASIQECSDVIFTKAYLNVAQDIMYAIDMNKNIISLFNLEDKLDEEICVRCKEKGLLYTNCTIDDLNMDSDDMPEYEIKKCTVPILLVVGLSKETQKFDVQLSLRESFLKRGYNVSQVGSKAYSRLFGMHNFPDFMFKNINEMDKVYLFNHFIHQIEIEENPELIILGIPGGIIPYDDKHPNGYGILNYLVSNAVKADYVIMSLSYNDYDKDFWEFIINYSQYRYGYNVNHFHISNIFHDINDNELQRSSNLIYLRNSVISDRICEWGLDNVFSVNCAKDLDKIADSIINYLSEDWEGDYR